MVLFHILLLVQFLVTLQFRIAQRLLHVLMFKECLKYNIVPFIIDEKLKMFYYRGLKEWEQEKGYLIDTCLAAQDQFKAYLDYFRIEYKK